MDYFKLLRMAVAILILVFLFLFGFVVCGEFDAPRIIDKTDSARIDTSYYSSDSLIVPRSYFGSDSSMILPPHATYQMYLVMPEFKINNYLKSGWSLYGSPFLGRDGIYQAITKDTTVFYPDDDIGGFPPGGSN